MTVSWNRSGKSQAVAALPPLVSLPEESRQGWLAFSYLLLAVGMIVAVAVGEVRSATQDIRQHLLLQEAAARAPLANALAGKGLGNVTAIARELASAPHIRGVAVHDAEHGLLLIAQGMVPDDDGRPMRREADGAPAQTFPAWRMGVGPIFHSFVVDPQRDGGGSLRLRVTLHADGGAILDRLAARGTTILAALIVQSAALWLLFLHLSRRMVSQPLARLTAQVGALGIDDHADPVPVAGNGRVSALEDAVHEMRRRIKFEFRSLIEISSEGVAVIQDGRFRFANRSLAALLGYDHPEALAMLPSVAEVLSPAHRGRGERLLARIAARLDALPHAHFHIEFPLAAPDGAGSWAEARFQRVDWRGRPGLLVSLADITRHKRRRDELMRQAIHDPLTGATNRRRFAEVAQREIDRSRRHRHPLAVLALDIDHFKAINDTHGHAAGDIVLKRMADKVSSTLRDSDLLGRMGGEEFAVLLPETDAAGAGALAERIRAGIAALNLIVGPSHIPVTVSIGVAGELGGHGETLSDGLRRADAALYRAKGGGRNRVETAAPPPPAFSGEAI